MLMDTKVRDIFSAILVFIVCHSIAVTSQSFDSKATDSKTITCYVKREKAIKIYEKSLGNETKVSLPTLSFNENCWYIIELLESKNERFKIKSIKILPSCQEIELPKVEGKWINKAENLSINSVYYDFDNGGILKLYSKPDYRGEVIATKTYNQYTVVDIKNGWVEISYLQNEVLRTAWMSPEDQCYLPWTVCPEN